MSRFSSKTLIKSALIICTFAGLLHSSANAAQPPNDPAFKAQSAALKKAGADLKQMWKVDHTIKLFARPNAKSAFIVVENPSGRFPPYHVHCYGLTPGQWNTLFSVPNGTKVSVEEFTSNLCQNRSLGKKPNLVVPRTDGLTYFWINY
jgi:hypothetical protein